jgi:hypothetical protein
MFWGRPTTALPVPSRTSCHQFHQSHKKNGSHKDPTTFSKVSVGIVFHWARFHWLMQRLWVLKPAANEHLETPIDFCDLVALLKPQIVSDSRFFSIPMEYIETVCSCREEMELPFITLPTVVLPFTHNAPIDRFKLFTLDCDFYRSL